MQDQSFENLYCALLFLLTRKARSPSLDLDGMIKDHLEWLTGHPETRNLPTLRKTSRRLAMHWTSGAPADIAPIKTTPVKPGRTDLH